MWHSRIAGGKLAISRLPMRHHELAWSIVHVSHLEQLLIGGIAVAITGSIG